MLILTLSKKGVVFQASGGYEVALRKALPYTKEELEESRMLLIDRVRRSDQHPPGQPASIHPFTS